MAFAPLAIMTAVQAVGALYQGFSQASQQSAASANAYANARNTRLQSSANEDAQRRQNALRMGNVRASAAQTGFDPSSGSLADLQSRSAGELELDTLTQRYQNELQALSFENEGATLKSAAKSSRIGGVLNAAGTIFGGYKASQARQLPGVPFYGIGSSPY